MKICTSCQQEKNLSEFHCYKTGPRKGTYLSSCTLCRYKYKNQKRSEDKQLHALQVKRSKYRNKFGLELEEVKSFGECPICLREKKLVTDHDHNAPRGTHRGFLCMNCNALLGSIENIEKIVRIKQYLGKEYL